MFNAFYISCAVTNWTYTASQCSKSNSLKIATTITKCVCWVRMNTTEGWRFCLNLCRTPALAGTFQFQPSENCICMWKATVYRRKPWLWCFGRFISHHAWDEMYEEGKYSTLRCDIFNRRWCLLVVNRWLSLMSKCIVDVMPYFWCDLGDNGKYFVLWFFFNSCI